MAPTTPAAAPAGQGPATTANAEKGAITGEAITAGANPWLVGGGFAALLSAIVAAGLYGRRKRVS